MDNNNKIINAIKKSETGLTITDLVNKTDLVRSQVRISLAFLMGSGEIRETKVGMAKLYTLK